MAAPSRKVAIVTGASGGIGLELSRLLARDDHDLVIVAQDVDRLDRAARELRSYGARVVEVATDLSHHGAPDKIAAELDTHGLSADVLVNNAGFGLQGHFVALDLMQQLRMVDLNVRALTHLTGLLLPGMVERRRGRVLNVASTAAFQPGPLMAVYYATKAYVLSFSEALANETERTGVTVTALCPGPTATSFEKRAGLEGRRLFRGPVMNAAVVAQQGYLGMQRGERVVVPGLRNRLRRELVRFSPRGIVLGAVRALHD